MLFPKNHMLGIMGTRLLSAALVEILMVIGYHRGFISASQLKREAFEKRLLKSREIDIGYTGRKTGRTFKIPVWFTCANGVLRLLPENGSATNWYKNLLALARMTLKMSGETVEVTANPLTDKKKVNEIICSFRAKYGEFRNDYSSFDVAVEIPLPAQSHPVLP